MKKIKIYFIFLVFGSLSAESPQKLLLLDTSGVSQANYTQVKMLADSVGFSTEFANLYTPPKSLESFDVVLFFVNTAFLQAAIGQEQHPLVERMQSLIKQFVKNDKHILGVLFPGMLPQTKNNYNGLCTFFEKLGINQNLCATLQNLAPCIFSTDDQRSSLYRTSLYPTGLPTQRKKKMRCNTTSLEKMKHAPITLPIEDHHTQISSILPMGTYLKPIKSAGLFLGADSSFAGAELEENIFFTPYHWKERQEYFKELQQVLWQLHFIAKHQKVPVAPNEQLSLPISVMPLTHTQKKDIFSSGLTHPLLKSLTRSGIHCAWMEIEPLKNTLKKAVSYIYESKLNLLWFSFNPEWYLSTKASRKSTDFQKIEQNISSFAKALHEKFEGKNLPAIFAGFDLTNNFKKAPLAQPVQNVYGTTFSKIPSPFDEKALWQEEFITPLGLFLDRWRILTDNKVALSGIFLDLEMYHAPEQAAVYSNQMDFSDLAWKVYARHTKNSALLENTTVKSRVSFLMKNKLFKDYFEVLEKEAQQLGAMLKKEIQKKIPNGLIGVYLPSLLDCWFYRGLLAGLSSKEEPIILATFNTNYYGHIDWLQQHNIYALHLPVIMLSHIKTPDPDLELKKFHDGIWINRFSRLFEPCTDKDWYRLECTQESHSLVIDHIKSYTQR